MSGGSGASNSTGRPDSRVLEDQPGGVEGLAGEGDGAELVGAVDVAALADQRVTAQAGLDAYLVAAAGLEADFEVRGGAEALDQPGNR